MKKEKNPLRGRRRLLRGDPDEIYGSLTFCICALSVLLFSPSHESLRIGKLPEPCIFIADKKKMIKK